jgi:hypothetical protein
LVSTLDEYKRSENGLSNVFNPKLFLIVLDFILASNDALEKGEIQRYFILAR